MAGSSRKGIPAAKRAVIGYIRPLNHPGREEKIMQSAKDQVRQLLEQLPDNATLSDIRYELNDSLYTLYVRERIAQGLEEVKSGCVTSHEEVRKQFLNGDR